MFGFAIFNPPSKQRCNIYELSRATFLHSCRCSGENDTGEMSRGKISTENRKTGTPLGKIGDDDLFNDFAISIQDNNALMKLNVKYSKAKACYLFPRYWRCFEISIERSTDIVDQRLSCDIPAGARK